jgi:hypothetical protein
LKHKNDLYNMQEWDPFTKEDAANASPTISTRLIAFSFIIYEVKRLTSAAPGDNTQKDALNWLQGSRHAHGMPVTWRASLGSK